MSAPNAGNRAWCRRAVVAASCMLASLGAAAPAAAREHAARARAAIVGGAPAAAGQWPWLAFVVDRTSSGVELCSGTVISPNVVLTAGHCAENLTTGAVRDPSGFTVVTGAADWTDATTRQVSPVARTIVSPTFNRFTADGDAALLQLATPTSAPAVPLADASDAGLLAAGTGAVIAGWGLTDASAADAPAGLQWGSTVVQRAAYCTQQETAAGSPFDAARQLCAIDPPSFGTTICRGDSGGPLLARAADGASVQIGITSRGTDAHCSPGLPAVFTRVDAISGWARAWVAALAPASTTTPPPTSPAPSTAPPAPSSPRSAPIAGLYRGRTSQRAPIALRLARTRSGTAITALTFSYALRCRARRLAFRITPVTRAHVWPVVDNLGRGFSDYFRDSEGARYHVTGVFRTGRLVAGTLHTLWHTRRYGTCDSGAVRFNAKRR